MLNPDSPPGRAVALIARHRVAVTVAFLVAFPWLVPYHALAVNILIWGLFALGFNLLYGYAGLLSFGHAAFLGVGSYGCGIAVVHLGLPWYLAIPCGVAFASLVALVVGFLAIRTRGIYFAMVTLALALNCGSCQYPSISCGLGCLIAKVPASPGPRMRLPSPITATSVPGRARPIEPGFTGNAG